MKTEKNEPSLASPPCSRDWITISTFKPDFTTRDRPEPNGEAHLRLSEIAELQWDFTTVDGPYYIITKRGGFYHVSEEQYRRVEKAVGIPSVGVSAYPWPDHEIPSANDQADRS